MPPPKPYREWNDLAAYQFDNAVLYCGLAIENALQERRKAGDESQPEYTLERLLDPDFRLPAAGGSPLGAQSTAIFKAMDAVFPGAVGRWKQVAKEV